MPTKRKNDWVVDNDDLEEKKELDRKAHAFDIMVEKMAPTLTETVFAKSATRTLRGGRIAYLTEDEYEFMKRMLEGSK